MAGSSPLEPRTRKKDRARIVLGWARIETVKQGVRLWAPEMATRAEISQSARRESGGWGI